MSLIRLGGDLPVLYGTVGNVTFSKFTRPFAPGEHSRYAAAEAARILCSDPNHRLVSIFDPGQTVRPDASERRVMAEFHRRNFEDIQRRTVVVILINDNAAHRGVFRAIGWITRLPYALDTAKNFDAALQLAAKTLEREGLPPLDESQLATLREYASEAVELTTADLADAPMHNLPAGT